MTCHHQHVRFLCALFFYLIHHVQSNGHVINPGHVVHANYHVFPLIPRNKNRIMEEMECEKLLASILEESSDAPAQTDEDQNPLFKATVEEAKTSLNEQKREICELIETLDEKDRQELFAVLARQFRPRF